MIKKEEFTILGKHSKRILIDIRFEESHSKKPLIIFCHGFKGFKDFGCFNLIADFFAMNGFVFLKFNFSHNGTTPEFPIDFVDLKAFSKNTFMIELDDLECVIDNIYNSKNELLNKNIDAQNITLIGHSRGGGIALLKAFDDRRIKNLITWASVNKFGNFWSDEVILKWKNEGIRYELNGRTKQNMPMSYRIYEDLEENTLKLDIPFAIKNLQKPYLIVHGENDETIKVGIALEIKNWNNNAELIIINGTNHTFDGKHPWETSQMPKKTLELVTKSLLFLNSLKNI